MESREMVEMGVSMDPNSNFNRVEYDASSKIVLQGLRLDHSSAEELGEQLQESEPWIRDAWVDNDYHDHVVVKVDPAPGFSQMSLEERSTHFVEAIDQTLLPHLGTNCSQVALSFTMKHTP